MIAHNSPWGHGSECSCVDCRMRRYVGPSVHAEAFSLSAEAPPHSEFSTEALVKLANLDAAIRSGFFRDDRRPMVYATWEVGSGRVERVTPWHLAMWAE